MSEYVKCEKCQSENMIEESYKYDHESFGELVVIKNFNCLDCHSITILNVPIELEEETYAKWRYCECGKLVDKDFCSKECKDKFMKKYETS